MDDLPKTSQDTGRASLSEEQRQELAQWVERANEKLFKAGADSAEQSFGLGCVIFALPVLGVVLVLWILQVFNLILALIILLMGALVVAGLVTLVAYNARTRAIGDTYRREIGPEIDQYLSEHGYGRPEFEQVAHDLLSTDAPLRSFLAPIPVNEFPPNEE